MIVSVSHFAASVTLFGYQSKGVQQYSRLVNEVWTNFATLVAVTAAISSILGGVKALIGATRLLDITNEMSLLLRR